MEKVIQTLGTLTSKLFGILQLDKVNSIIQADKINSTVDEAEGKVSTWIALIYDLASIIFLGLAVWNFINIFKEDKLSGLEGKESIGLLVGGIIWLYAAFPLMSVIRRTADRLRTPGDSIVNYMFKDFVIANIKMVGQLIALTGLFVSITMLLSWATDITMKNWAIGTTAESVQWMFKIPMDAVASFTQFIGVESINEFVSKMTNNGIDVANGWKLDGKQEPQSMDGLIAVLYSFAKVILVLVQLYVSVAIYTFMYGLASTFLNWVKSPYLPMKSL